MHKASIAFVLFALFGSVACSETAEESELSDSSDLRRNRCGNGVCAGTETCSSCPADCGPCTSTGDAGSAAPDAATDAATGDAATATIDAGANPNAKHYYVATAGSDSSNGLCPTTATPGCTGGPWATISHADSALSPGANGTIVHVAPGTYGGAITTSQSGSASARITFVSDTAFAAKLTGGTSGVAWSVQGAYTDVVGFEIDAVAHTEVQNGIVAYSHSTLVRGNKVHNVASGCNSSQTAVLESAGPHNAGEGNVFEDNVVYHNNCGAGSWTAGIQSGAVNTGISLHSYDIARNNLVIDQDGWGIQVSHDSTNNIVTNNTIINCDRGGIVVGYVSGTVDYATISNNIVVNNGSVGGDGGIDVNGSGCGVHNLYANNLVYGNTGGNYIFDGCTNTATGTQTGSNATTFVSYTGTMTGNYHLASGSTAIDTGTTACAFGSCAPSVDLEGAARPHGAAVDIGAYEFY
jgi:hypothetical protein